MRKLLNWKVLTLSLILQSFTSLFAQDNEKITIGILPFTYSNSGQRYTYTIQENVENAFTKAKRFNMVERSRLAELRAEKDLQKHEDFMDSKVLVSQGKSLGARYLISGHVVSADYEEVYSTTNNVRKFDGYRGKVSVIMKVIDVENGEIMNSENIQVSGSGGFLGGLMSYQTPETAIVEAIKGMDKQINKFIGTNFPVRFKIVEIQEKKDNKAKSVLLAGGSNYGLSKGDRLSVYEVKEVTLDNKTLQRKVEVGELKVSKVEDENFSVCSVVSGGEAIAEKLAGSKLYVSTK
ncbi:MAG: CsgG/HfaB family protein [Candidatus Dadabacteria bacterium]